MAPPGERGTETASARGVVRRAAPTRRRVISLSLHNVQTGGFDALGYLRLRETVHVDLYRRRAAHEPAAHALQHAIPSRLEAHRARARPRRYFDGDSL